MQIIYIEEAIKNHPRVLEIVNCFDKREIIYCQHYGEIFNRKAQNFRIQKQNPALILASKNNRTVLPTPEGFGIGGEHNYYFSHMLNCLYDCRYCFLQGLYPSAHYVIFINYEDFMNEITEVCASSEQKNIYFFSGYDCDSLAFEPVTAFLKSFLPFFEKCPKAILECRTKSTNIREILKYNVLPNVVIAYSFTPKIISQKIEYKVPSLEKRLTALAQLAAAGWAIGLRFDPLIYTQEFKSQYQELIDQIFSHINSNHVHSVSVGPLRFPEKMYQKIVKLYPHEKLLAQPLYKRNNYYSYHSAIEQEMKEFIHANLKNYLNSNLIFECNPL